MQVDFSLAFQHTICYQLLTQRKYTRNSLPELPPLPGTHSIAPSLSESVVK